MATLRITDTSGLDDLAPVSHALFHPFGGDWEYPLLRDSQRRRYFVRDYPDFTAREIVDHLVEKGLLDRVEVTVAPPSLLAHDEAPGVNGM